MNQHLNQEGEANRVLLEVSNNVSKGNETLGEVKETVGEVKEIVVDTKTTLGAMTKLLQYLVTKSDGPTKYLPVRFDYKRGHEDEVVKYAGSQYMDVNALLRSSIATIDNGVLMLDSKSEAYVTMQTDPYKDVTLATTVSIINRILFAMMNNKISKYYPKENSKKVFVYRITKDLPDDMIASLKVGEFFMDKSFMSTSKKESLWKEQSGFKFLFKIECLGGGNGFNIQGLVQPHKQYGAEEAEVLFLPRTYFEITKVEATHDENYGDITLVEMKEV